MKKITVIGAGGTGHTIAADLALRGYDVRLCDSEAYRDILERTAANGGVRTSGMMGEGFAKIPMITTDVARALEGVEQVICCTIFHNHPVTKLPVETLARWDLEQILTNVNTPGDYQRYKEDFYT